MNKDQQNRISDRLRDLIKRGASIAGNAAPSNVSGGNLDPFYSWQTGAISTLTAAFSTTGFHTLRFTSFFPEGNIHYSQVSSGVGVLRAALEDIETGMLEDQRRLLAAELFDSQLDIAEHLLDEGMYQPAASLIGAILEINLRERATGNSIDLSQVESIGSLSQKLLKHQVISRTRFKGIDAWRAIRNHADHGQFDKFSEGEVRSMLIGVRDFLAT